MKCINWKWNMYQKMQNCPSNYPPTKHWKLSVGDVIFNWQPADHWQVTTENKKYNGGSSWRFASFLRTDFPRIVENKDVKITQKGLHCQSVEFYQVIKEQTRKLTVKIISSKHGNHYGFCPNSLKASAFVVV